jgi:dCMP deaminase
MSNIFHEIKHGFLIIGFTGPLSSGCSTAANFFINDIDQYIDKRTTKALPRIQSQIKRILREIKENKRMLEVEIKNRHKLHQSINRLHSRLKEQLNLRETLTVLSEYKESRFMYISMTDMLVKLTIESLSNKKDEDLEETIRKLKSLIVFDPLKLEKAIEISKQLKNRVVSDLTQSDIKIFEDFLKYVAEYREELKTKFNDHELGCLLQDLGDNARRCGDPVDYNTKFDQKNAKTLFVVASEANDIIKFFRNRKRSGFGLEIFKKFAIEAFRNPYEVEFFRNRYYEFFLFSIYAPETLRKSRGNYNKGRDYRDKGHGIKANEFFKQNVSDCVHLSDIAVNNDSEKLLVFQRKLSKYYSLICRPGCIAPTDDELFMQEAYSMSLKSNCISRQVGAVIVGQRGYIVGAGWNDVGSGQISCGLRRFGDVDESFAFPIAVKGEEEIFSSFLEQSSDGYKDHCYCFKDEYSKFQTNKRVNKLLSGADSPLKNWINENELSSEAVLNLSKIASKNLSMKRLEYCRALHAEENAILQSSIIGGIGIEGATIYTTTFPCELCAKKIYQSRIKRVIFTEPYPESISEDVFFKDGSHSIELMQFEGVKSYSYYRLYKSTVNKKEFQIQEKI